MGASSIAKTLFTKRSRSVHGAKHLYCIPGVSARIALAIQKEYPTMRALLNAYFNDWIIGKTKGRSHLQG